MNVLLIYLRNMFIDFSCIYQQLKPPYPTKKILGLAEVLQ